MFITSSSVFYDKGGNASGSLFHGVNAVHGVRMRAFNEDFLPEWVKRTSGVSGLKMGWPGMVACALAAALAMFKTV